MARDQRIRVGVLFGGRSCEHEVSLGSTNECEAVRQPTRHGTGGTRRQYEGHVVGCEGELKYGGGQGAEALHEKDPSIPRCVASLPAHTDPRDPCVVRQR